jgi:hypothetical protein
MPDTGSFYWAGVQKQGYLVDVSPEGTSTEGAEIVTMVLPVFDGEGWMDVLWLFQPKEAPALPVNEFIALSWPIAYHDTLSLEQISPRYVFGKASDPAAMW